jgi:cyclopropane-fatty-acyl-phospholipid synthase
MRLLDVGCGWGSLVLHAAEHHGVHVTGVTLSREQRDHVRVRVDKAGLGGSVEVRLQDYRDVDDPPFDAVAPSRWGNTSATRTTPATPPPWFNVAPTGRMVMSGAM